MSKYMFKVSNKYARATSAGIISTVFIIDFRHAFPQIEFSSSAINFERVFASWFTKAYLGICQSFMMEPFYENS